MRTCRMDIGELVVETMDDWLRKMKLAVDVLLAEADEISDSLEAELYALRDKLDVIALEQTR